MKILCILAFPCKRLLAQLLDIYISITPIAVYDRGSKATALLDRPLVYCVAGVPCFSLRSAVTWIAEVSGHTSIYRRAVVGDHIIDHWPQSSLQSIRVWAATQLPSTTSQSPVVSPGLNSNPYFVGYSFSRVLSARPGT